jgi:hypothetical protein
MSYGPLEPLGIVSYGSTRVADIGLGIGHPYTPEPLVPMTFMTFALDGKPLCPTSLECQYQFTLLACDVILYAPIDRAGDDRRFSCNVIEFRQGRGKRISGFTSFLP